MRARISPPNCAAGFRSWPDRSSAKISCAPWNRRDRRAYFLDRRERVARAMRRQRGVHSSGKNAVRSCSCLRGGCSGYESSSRPSAIGMLGRRHRGLPSAVGMSAGEDAPRSVFPDRLHRRPHAFAIARRAGWKRRAARPLDAKRQIVAQHHDTGAFERAGQSVQQRRIQVDPARGSAPEHRRSDSRAGARLRTPLSSKVCSMRALCYGSVLRRSLTRPDVAVSVENAGVILARDYGFLIVSTHPATKNLCSGRASIRFLSSLLKAVLRSSRIASRAKPRAAEIRIWLELAAMGRAL